MAMFHKVKTVFENGETVETPFDNLMAFTDATELWGLNESTLRKAISYGKLVTGIDACKYGKQWVIYNLLVVAKRLIRFTCSWPV